MRLFVGCSSHRGKSCRIMALRLALNWQQNCRLSIAMGGNLEEVIFNLVHNAIEAMDAARDRGRLLRVRTELNDHDAITVAVQDSRPGIDPKKSKAYLVHFLRQSQTAWV